MLTDTASEERYNRLMSAIAGSDPARPYVVAQLGQSLDGRIATAHGCGQLINGPAALDHLHALRAHVDAVVVGVGTIVADNPQLTVRRVPGRNPTRVIIDPHGRMPVDARCLHDGAGDVLRIVGTSADPGPGSRNAIVLPLYGGRFDPDQIVKALFERGLRRILVEGGATTVSSFIAAGAVDRLHVMLAPIIIGSGLTGLNLPPIASMAASLRPATSIFPLSSGDVLFDCDLRDSRSRAR